MAAFKNKDNGTWYVQFRYTDWRGERQQKLKRGFATKKRGVGLGTGIPDGKTGRYKYDL